MKSLTLKKVKKDVEKDKKKRILIELFQKK